MQPVVTFQRFLHRGYQEEAKVKVEFELIIFGGDVYRVQRPFCHTLKVDGNEKRGGSGRT